jgi:hypothetical protein
MMFSRMPRPPRQSLFDGPSTVFWVAVDYYERAMRIPSCKSDAESKIKFLNSYFPNVEEIFFRELSVGQRYTVGGWINETTSVRARQ